MVIDQATIERVVDLLLRAAPAGSKVILFGSYASGEARPDSDVDFLVVEPQVNDRFGEMVRLRQVLRPLLLAVDVLVVSARTYEEWRDTPNTVVYEAAHKGKVYEQVA